jgi:hypothetical protein
LRQRRLEHGRIDALPSPSDTFHLVVLGKTSHQGLIPWSTASITRGAAMTGTAAGFKRERRGPFTPLLPHSKQSGATWRRFVFDFPTEFGRRDWTRTNDPHHVKVVL